MAFWNKKSEDPWDIDPEKRRTERAAFYEAENTEPVEPEESGGFLSGLFGKKEPEEELPVPCPYCGAEMELGYLICGRGAIHWTKVKPGVLLGNLFAETIPVSDEGLFNEYKTCHFCSACRKIVVDVPEQTESWSAPTEPSEESADEAYERYREQLKDYQ